MPKHFSKIAFFLPFIFATSSFAIEDNLFKSMEMMLNANEYQSERVKIATENIANENSTAIKPGGNPYRRKIIIPGSKYDRKLKANLLKVRKYDFDKSEFKLKYDPYHPAADAHGYVLMPNVDRSIEKADVMDANRAYEAGLGVMETSKSMIQKTLETLK
jgi:flagellar basal-body rod protein FlgC